MQLSQVQPQTVGTIIGDIRGPYTPHARGDASIACLWYSPDTSCLVLVLAPVLRMGRALGMIVEALDEVGLHCIDVCTDDL